MENISIFVIMLFLLTTAVTVWLFFKAADYSKTLMLSVSAWIIIQSVLGLSGFYTNRAATQPRFFLLIGPPVLFIIVLFMRTRGRHFIDSLRIDLLTILFAIRIPVEITLYYIFIAGLIPRSMTFEGSNFDLFSGVTAPLLYYFVFIARRANLKLLLVWNFICLGLLLNVVVTAILSAKTPFQQLAFDQPNIGVTYFPFVLLPAVIVPIVLFSHLASIRQIVKAIREEAHKNLQTA